jgi:hypothetical protein
MERKICQWLLTGETGVSSKTMVCAALGIAPKDKTCNWPHDMGDFGRCWKLVKVVPELRDHFSTIAGLSPAWASVIREFDTIGALYEKECDTPNPWRGEGYKLLIKTLGEHDIFKGRSFAITVGA